MNKHKSISAVILAGGFGTRLRPLTDTKPKPLVTILDTPVLEVILKQTEKLSPESITVSAFCKSEMIQKAVSELCPAAVCKRESVPLGTAGAVKFCFDGKTDAVLVVSGDGVFDFDLQETIDFHFENGNDVTIVGCRKPDPTEYGVIVSDENNNVVDFCEKPSWKKVRSGLVNTGIYVLSRRMIEAIPDNMVYDFSENLFPRLLKEGRRMKVFTSEGYWCDIGTLDEYFACNRLAAQGKLRPFPNCGREERTLRNSGVHVENGCYVARNAHIGKNVKISDSAVVCKNVYIGNNCDLSSCIIGVDSHIGNGTGISRTVIGRGVSIGENCIIPDGCVIGDGCRIADGAVLKKHTSLEAQKCVFGEDGIMSVFSDKRNIFVDDGLCSLDSTLPGGNICRLANAVAVCFAKGEKRNAFIGVVSSRSARHLKGAFVSGLMSRNACVLDCGEGGEGICSYASAKVDADAFVHIGLCGQNAHITVMSSDGVPIDDETERKISKIYSLSEDVSTAEHSTPSGDIVFIPIEAMYRASAISFSDKILNRCDLKGISFCFSNKALENECACSVLSEVLERAGANKVDLSDKNTVSITLSADGKRAGVRCENCLLDANHISAIILKNKELLGMERVGIDNNAPSVLQSLSDKHENITAFPEGFVLKDAVLSVVALLTVSVKSKKSIKMLYDELSPFEIYTDEYIADINKADAVERLSRLYHDSGNLSVDGIRLSLADGVVTVIPNRAKGFKIISEAVSMETAKELSVRIGNVIKGKE